VKSGGILDGGTRFPKFNLELTDVLELWRAPYVINVGNYRHCFCL
jgi:hypothetical protein